MAAGAEAETVVGKQLEDNTTKALINVAPVLGRP